MGEMREARERQEGALQVGGLRRRATLYIGCCTADQPSGRNGRAPAVGGALLLHF